MTGVGRLCVGFGVGRLGELFGEALVFGAGGVEVCFGSFGADAECVAGFFQGGDAGAGGGGELVECVLVVGADAAVSSAAAAWACSARATAAVSA